MCELTIYTSALFLCLFYHNNSFFKAKCAPPYFFVTRTRSISVPSIRKHAISIESRVTSIVR